MALEISTYRIETELKKDLEGIADLHNTSVSEIIRKCLIIFHDDKKFQREILEEVKRP